MNDLEEVRRRFPRGTRVRRIIRPGRRRPELLVVEGIVSSVATGRTGPVLLVRNAETPMTGANRYPVSEWEPIEPQEAMK